MRLHRSRTRSILPILLLVALWAVTGAAESPRGLERLIAELDDDSLAVRNEADRRLGKRTTIPLALRAALESNSAEVRRRVKRILFRIEARLAEDRFSETKRLLDQGFLDRAIEHTIRWQAHDANCLNVKHLAAFVERIRRAETDRYQIGPPPFGTDERAGAKKLDDLVSEAVSFSRGHLVTARSTSAVLVGAGVEVRARRGENLFIVSGGSVELQKTSATLYSIVLAGGSVSTGMLARDIIVSDGNVEIGNTVSGVLVVARGNITLRTKIHSSGVFIAGGKISHEMSEDAARSKLFAFRPNEHKGMPLIKYFETTQVGLETVADLKGAKMNTVRKGSIFAARLLPGDVVTAIDKDATPDRETFRRTLRRALANVGSEMAFHVLRDGKAVEVALTIPALPDPKAAAPAKP